MYDYNFLQQFIRLINYSRRIRFTCNSRYDLKKNNGTSKRISFYIDEAYNSFEQLFICLPIRDNEKEINVVRYTFVQ